MLILIGFGFAPADLSLRAIAAAQRCDALYLETYTTVTTAAPAAFKEIKQLHRTDLEENASQLIAAAKQQTIGILVPGDPLAATTHSALVLEAKKAGIAVEVIHAASIFSAIAETGLQLYKFGKTVTLASPQKGYGPTGWYADVLENKRRGLHTLLLLDSGTGGKPMLVAEAVALLRKAEGERQQGLFTPETKLVVACLGKGVIRYAALSQLAAEFPLPAALVLPGTLHFQEEEFLATLESS